jgi:2-haloacid dehalogenase
MHGRMPLPKEVTFVTFDVYGTLIDSDTGIYEAFSKEAERDGYTISRDELVNLFKETQKEIKGGSYELYAEVLRRTAVQISKQLGWPLEPSRSGFLPDSVKRWPPFKETQKEIKGGSYELYAEVLRRTAVQISKQLGWPLEPSRSGFLPDSVKRWPPFKETNTQLERFKKKFEIGLIANIDDKLLGETRRHFKVDFDLVVTAQQVRSYKPDPAHFKEAERRLGGKKGWVHVASDYYYDVEPCLKAKVPVIWVNRSKEQLDSSQKKPTAEVKTLLEAAKLLGAA